MSLYHYTLQKSKLKSNLSIELSEYCKKKLFKCYKNRATFQKERNINKKKIAIKASVLYKSMLSFKMILLDDRSFIYDFFYVDTSRY